MRPANHGAVMLAARPSISGRLTRLPLSSRGRGDKVEIFIGQDLLALACQQPADGEAGLVEIVLEPFQRVGLIYCHAAARVTLTQ